jgi:uncharacterized protein (UPF0548 family)
MLLWRRPSHRLLTEVLAAGATLPFSYPEVGATRNTLPRGYFINRHAQRLGAGPACYAAASRALQDWRMFTSDWVRLEPRRPAISPGVTFAVYAHHYGLWSLNLDRIVYTIADERQYGFAIGTLPWHVERGEERFVVEWHTDDSVWFHLLAFAGAAHPLVRMAGPLGRRVQRRFAREAGAAMAAAVGAGD